MSVIWLISIAARRKTKYSVPAEEEKHKRGMEEGIGKPYDPEDAKHPVEMSPLNAGQEPMVVTPLGTPPSDGLQQPGWPAPEKKDKPPVKARTKSNKQPPVPATRVRDGAENGAPGGVENNHGGAEPMGTSV